MKKILFSGGVIALIIAIAFLKINVNKYIIGYYTGECFSNCSSIFLVNGEKVVKDTSGIVFFTSHKLDEYRTTSDNNFFSKKGKSVPISIRIIDILLPITQIGCPDCSDQGGYFLQFKKLGLLKTYYIDPEYKGYFWNDLKYEFEKCLEKIE